MFLDICGSLSLVKDKFVADFQPYMYGNFELDRIIPLYIILEGLMQMACRASSTAVFYKRPCFPAQVKILEYRTSSDSIRYHKEQLKLIAGVHKRNNMSEVECSLVDVNYNILVYSEIWTALR